MNNYIVKSLFVLFFIFLTIIGCTKNNNDRVFWSPYEDLNWENIGHYDAQFHVHPGLGAEEYDPQEAVDRYFEEGYKIVALSPHDYDIPDDYIESLYPWTEFSNIYETIKDVENPTESDMTYEEFANGPYKDRDPVDLDMVSIEASEISCHHHTISLFNNYTKCEGSEDESLEIIQERGGIAYFAHPGRYDLTEYWYADKYLRFDALIGQIVYNRDDHHPEDRNFYDRVVNLLGAERPIWLYGEDDMHQERDLARNRNVILLENFEPGSLHPDIQDGSAADVKEALQKGYSYFFKPSEQYGPRTFNIVDVIISDTDIKLIVDNDDLVEEIRWRTHDSLTKDTETIHFGYSISTANVPEHSKFVRAEIDGEGGSIYTQPFYLVTNDDEMRE